MQIQASHGLPLVRALEEFCRPELVLSWKAWLRANRRAPSDPWRDLLDEFRTKVVRGDLVTFAYQKPMNLSKPRTEIPADWWTWLHVYPSGDGASGHGVELLDIRVYRREEIERAQLLDTKSEKEKSHLHLAAEESEENQDKTFFDYWQSLPPATQLERRQRGGQAKLSREMAERYKWKSPQNVISRVWADVDRASIRTFFNELLRNTQAELLAKRSGKEVFVGMIEKEFPYINEPKRRVDDVWLEIQKSLRKSKLEK